MTATRPDNFFHPAVDDDGNLPSFAIGMAAGVGLGAELSYVSLPV